MKPWRNLFGNAIHELPHKKLDLHSFDELKPPDHSLKQLHRSLEELLSLLGRSPGRFVLGMLWRLDFALIVRLRCSLLLFNFLLMLLEPLPQFLLSATAPARIIEVARRVI